MNLLRQIGSTTTSSLLPTKCGAFLPPSLAQHVTKIPSGILPLYCFSYNTFSTHQKKRRKMENVQEAQVVPPDLPPGWVIPEGGGAPREKWSKATRNLDRANDGIWAPKKDQGHSRKVSRAHLDAEMAYGSKDYNDYLLSVQNTRERLFDEEKKKRLFGEKDEEYSDEDDGFINFKLMKRREMELAKAHTQEEKNSVMDRYSERMQQEVYGRLVMVVGAIAIFGAVTYDSINPDTLF